FRNPRAGLRNLAVRGIRREARPPIWVVVDPSPRQMRDKRPMGLASALPEDGRLAEFELRAVLGEGGTPGGYAARRGDRRPPPKVLREGLELTEREVKRFVDEARRMVLVDHPGLVKLESAGVLPDGRPYLAMPFVEGRTLARRLEEGALSAEHAIFAF